MLVLYLGGDLGNNKEESRDKKYYSNDKFVVESCLLGYMNLTAPFQVPGASSHGHRESYSKDLQEPAGGQQASEPKF